MGNFSHSTFIINFDNPRLKLEHW